MKTATYADPRGNMTLVAAGSVSMSYDGESRQTKTVDPGNGVTMNYLYDGAGQRVQKQSSNGTTTVDVHDVFGQLVAEYSSVGVTPACTTCYLTYDGLGSVRLVTDQNAGIVTRHDYLPYGEEIPNGSAGRCCNNFGNTANVTQMFTGQERDGGTADLDYFNARHMSNILGRFTQPDPKNAGAHLGTPQSWNAYAYVAGNPLRFSDPSGKDFCEGSDASCDGQVGEIPSDGGPSLIPIPSASPTGCVYPGSDICEVISGSALQPAAPQAAPQGGTLSPTNDGSIDDKGLSIITMLGQNTNAQYAFIGKFAIASATTGAGLGTVRVAAQAANEALLGPATGRVFYSGAGMFDAATSQAAAVGSRLLSATSLGKGVASLPAGALQNYAWGLVSRLWASGAAGSISVHLNNPSADSYYMKSELPLILKNVNIFRSWKP